jgi:hypothetical protein
LVDETLAKLMRSGEFEKLYTQWFESPIPPRGINIQLPMSDALSSIGGTSMPRAFAALRLMTSSKVADQPRLPLAECGRRRYRLGRMPPLGWRRST